MAVKVIETLSTISGVTTVQNWENFMNNNYAVLNTAAKKFLKIIDADLEFKGTAGDLDSGPLLPTLNDAYIAREAGTIFGLVAAYMDIIYWNGVIWVLLSASGPMSNLIFLGTTADIDFDIPIGYTLKYIVFDNGTANAATLDLGTTAFGSDIFVNTVIAANKVTTVTIFRTFSFSAIQTLYLNANAVGSSWNSATIDIYVVIEPVTY